MNVMKLTVASAVFALAVSASAAIRHLEPVTLVEGSMTSVKAYNATGVQAVTPNVAGAAVRGAEVAVSGLSLGTSEVQLTDERGVFASFQVRVVPGYWEVLTKIFEDDPEVKCEIIGGKVVLSGTTASPLTFEHVRRAQELDPSRIVSQVACSPEAVQAAVQDFLAASAVSNVTAAVTGREVYLKGRVYDAQSAVAIGKRVEQFLADFKEFSVSIEGLKVFRQKILINIEFLEWDDTRARNLGIKLGDTIDFDGKANYGANWSSGEGGGSSGSDTGGGTGGGESSGGNGQNAGVSVNASMKATINLAKRNGVARKTYGTQLSTQSGEEVRFQNGGTTYIRTTAGVGSSGELRQFDYGYQITATPLIVDSDTLNLTFNLDYSKLSDRTAAQQQSGDYSINRYQTKSKYVMRPGESILISGFDSVEESEAKDGWPLLSHIWGLQWLFGNTDRAREHKEMVLVVNVDWAVEDTEGAKARVKELKDREISVEMP